MRVKGRLIGGGWVRAGLAPHLLDTKGNERVQLLGASGLVAADDDLQGQLNEMRFFAANENAGVFHAKLNPGQVESQAMTEAQWRETVAEYVRRQGFENHQYFAVLHEKEGRTHAHVVVGRRNLETSKSYQAHHQNAVDMRIQAELCEALPYLGQPSRRGYDAEGNPRSPRPVRGHDFDAGRRTGLDPRKIAADLQSAWIDAQGDRDQFVAAVEKQGLTIERGRKCWVARDQAGTAHSLPRRLGLKSREVDSIMSRPGDPQPGLAPSRPHSLPDVDSFPGDAARRAHIDAELEAVRARLGRNAAAIDRLEIDDRGNRIFTMSDSSRVFARDKSVAADRAGLSRDQARLMIDLAQQRGWAELQLTGTRADQALLRREAERAGLTIVDAAPKPAPQPVKRRAVTAADFDFSHLRDHEGIERDRQLRIAERERQARIAAKEAAERAARPRFELTGPGM